MNSPSIPNTGPEGISPAPDFLNPQGQGPVFPAGQRVLVDVTRCVAEGEEWPPRRPRETYEATVVRQSRLGMVYVKAGARVGVVHPDSVRTLP